MSPSGDVQQCCVDCPVKKRSGGCLLGQGSIAAVQQRPTVELRHSMTAQHLDAVLPRPVTVVPRFATVVPGFAQSLWHTCFAQSFARSSAEIMLRHH